jgi:hypothetical protein
VRGEAGDQPCAKLDDDFMSRYLRLFYSDVVHITIYLHLRKATIHYLIDASASV